MREENTIGVTRSRGRRAGLVGLTVGVLALSAFTSPAHASAPPAPPQGSCAPAPVVTATPGLAIPSGPSSVSSPFAIAGLDPYVLDVDVTTSITHTFAADLDITLTSPAGTVVTLTTDNGAANDNVFNGTLWDDDAGDTNPPGPVTDATFTNLVVETPLVPEEALGAFVGEDPNGTWTLSITDDVAGDAGTLASWSLHFTVCAAAPPPTPLGVTATPGLAIPSGPSSVSSPLTVSGACPYLLDLDVGTSITHTFAADLDITLTSPAGTVVTLTTDNGAANDNVFNGTLWDDDAGDTNPPGPVTDATYTNLVVETPLVPEEALGAFVGEDPNGTWTLSITDDAAGDAGTLHAWSVSGRAVCAPPPPPVVQDTTPPDLTLAAKRVAKLKAVLRRGYAFQATCSETCTLVAQLRLAPKLAKKLKLPQVVGQAAKSLQAGQATKVVVKLKAKAKRKFKKLRKVVLQLVTTATDPAGNKRTVKKKVVLRR